MGTITPLTITLPIITPLIVTLPIITPLTITLPTIITQVTTMAAGAPPSPGETTMVISMATVEVLTQGRVPGVTLLGGTMAALIITALNSTQTTLGLIKPVEIMGNNHFHNKHFEIE